MAKKHQHKRTAKGRTYESYRKSITYKGRQFRPEAKSKADWEARVAAWKKEVDSSLLSSDPKLTVNQLAEMFKDDARTTKRPSTIQERVLHVDKYIVPAIGHLKLRDVRNEHCEKVLERTSTPSMGDHCLKVLKRMFEFAIENQMVITVNPISLGLTKRVKAANAVAKGDREPKPDFNMEMLDYVMVEFVNQPYEVMGHWLFLHGLRIGEALSMRWEDIDFDGGWIHINRQASSVSKASIRGSKWDTDTTGPIVIPPKTESSKRRIPLAPPTMALLLRTPEEERNGFIYATKSGNPQNANNFRRQVWYPLIKRLGIDWLDSHDLRKAYGSWLLIQSTADFQTVSKWMGHSNPSVTLAIYAKAFEEAELKHKNDMGLAFPMR